MALRSKETVLVRMRLACEHAAQAAYAALGMGDLEAGGGFWAGWRVFFYLYDSALARPEMLPSLSHEFPAFVAPLLGKI